MGACHHINCSWTIIAAYFSHSDKKVLCSSSFLHSALHLNKKKTTQTNDPPNHYWNWMPMSQTNSKPLERWGPALGWTQFGGLSQLNKCPYTNVIILTTYLQWFWNVFRKDQLSILLCLQCLTSHPTWVHCFHPVWLVSESDLYIYRVYLHRLLRGAVCSTPKLCHGLKRKAPGYGSSCRRSDFFWELDMFVRVWHLKAQCGKEPVDNGSFSAAVYQGDAVAERFWQALLMI